MLEFHSLEVAEVRPETDNAVSVTFRIPDSLATDYEFTQGQHVNVRKTLGGEEIRRCYSICSPVGGDLKVVVKHVEDGMFSTFARDELKVGDQLEVMTPTGRFFTPLVETNAKTYVAFVAGSGITPIISIIETTLEREPNSRFILFYGNREIRSIIFLEALEDLKNRFMQRFSLHHILSGEHQEVQLYNGRIDGSKAKQLIESFCTDGEPDEYFVCGPGTMIKDVRLALTELGTEPGHIHIERFTNASVTTSARPTSSRAKTADGDTRVTVIIDGRQREFTMERNGDKLLDAAYKQGIELPFSCKGGACSTCRTKLEEGQVEMEVNYALEPWELEAGFILACQSEPRTDKIVLNYDNN